MDQLRFDIPEILSLIGLSQCIYVLVYMLFRAGDIKRALLPFLYFFVLGTAFFFDFSQNFIGAEFRYFGDMRWAAWFMGPPLSVLLIIQIAQISRIPRLFNFWVLFFVPAAYIGAKMATVRAGECTQLPNCAMYLEMLMVTGLVAGALSMLLIWANRGMMDGLHAERGGKDRYWLILTLVFVNLFFLGVMLMGLSPVLGIEQARLIRTCLGIGLVYLTGTSLFRIYPQAMSLIERRNRDMSTDEMGLAKRIEAMIDLDKVYHEPGYNRADLARELKIPESVISKVTNLHFGKSLPQILNERRVEDAKRMLRETDAPVKVIAGEVGFNSMASFNRIFRDITAMTPSDYRNSVQEKGE